MYSASRQFEKVVFLAIAGEKIEHVAGKNRTSLITMINNHLQREELEELEDMGISELLLTKDKVTELHAEVAMTEHLTKLQAKSNEEKNGQDEAQVTTAIHTTTFSDTGPGQTPPPWHK